MIRADRDGFYYLSPSTKPIARKLMYQGKKILYLRKPQWTILRKFNGLAINEELLRFEKFDYIVVEIKETKKIYECSYDYYMKNATEWLYDEHEHQLVLPFADYRLVKEDADIYNMKSDKTLNNTIPKKKEKTIKVSQDDDEQSVTIKVFF